MDYQKSLNWKCYCPECHHAFVNPVAMAEELKVAYIDFICQGCGRPRTVLVLLFPKKESVFKRWWRRVGW